MSSIAILDYKQDRTTLARKAGLDRFLVLIVGLLSAVLVLELAFHFFIAPKLVIDHIQVTADQGFPLTEAQVLAIAGLDQTEYYFSLNAAAVRSRLAAYPLVKDATVRKIFPNGLSISLQPRIPFAVSLVDSGSGSVPVAFDDQGVVIRVGESAIGRGNLPIISGVSIPAIQVGMRLPSELVAFLGELRQIKEQSPGLFAAISEVRFVRLGGSNFDVVLYPRDYHVRVRIGNTIDAHELSYIMMVLEVTARQGMINKVDELDFRTGQVIYKLKEGG